MGPVANDDRGLAGRAIGSGAAVDPDAVGRVEGALAVASTAERIDPLRILVVAVDLEGAVAVGEQEAAVIQEGEVRRQEALPVPTGRGGGVFAGRIGARLHRCLAIPDDLTGGRHLREALHLLVAADIEKLLVPLLADLDAVAAPLKLAAECADEFPVGVEDEDRRMVLLILLPLVDHVEVASRVDSDVVRGLPGEPVRQLREIVAHTEGVCAFAEDRLATDAADLRQGRRRGGRGGEGCHAGERATGDAGRDVVVGHGELLVRLKRAAGSSPPARPTGHTARASRSRASRRLPSGSFRRHAPSWRSSPPSRSRCAC